MLSKVKVINRINIGLLSEAFIELRAVGINWNNDKFTITSYINGDIADEDYSSAGCISNELMTLYSNYKFDDKVINLNEPIPIPTHMALGYMRKEKNRFISFERILEREFIEYGQNLKPKIIFAINQSLLNQVTPELREINSSWNDSIIDMYIDYYQFPFDKEAQENIITNFMAYFPKHRLNLHIQQSNPFEKINCGSLCGYSAREIRAKEEE